MTTENNPLIDNYVKENNQKDNIPITKPDYENNYNYSKTICIAYVIFVISAGIGFLCIIVWKYFFKNKSKTETIKEKLTNGFNNIKNDLGLSGGDISV